MIAPDGGTVHLVRVIGGMARGRRLQVPRSPAVRPTSDRVREAIFDVLGHLDAVVGAEVVDLFAGSGALGIEALSRGAASVTFVESDPVVARGLEANLAAVGFAGAPRVRVVRREATGFLAGVPHRYDLALADPPYAFGGWPELLGHLRAGVAVLESDRPLELPAGLELHRSYRYGGTLVTVARAPERAGEQPAALGGGPAALGEAGG